MRSLIDQDTIQIECTTRCLHRCSNCTRAIGHYPPWDMSFDQFKKAVDSMEAYPKMTGMTGGDPLLHPEFEKFCEYLHQKIPPNRCGLWTCLPEGKEHYREIIVKTFGHIFPNTHERDDILHSPVLVSIQEFPLEKWAMWYTIEHCNIQMVWSASINPHGAFFCEMAASLSMLLDMDGGWPIEPQWWTRTPKDFVSQMEKYCPLCGMAVPLKKRVSTEEIDDISPGMYERLKDTSPKIKKGKYQIHNLAMCNDNRQMATYKDPKYREGIANRYGLFLFPNEQHFLTPYLRRNWKKESKIQPESEVNQNDYGTFKRQEVR